MEIAVPASLQWVVITVRPTINEHGGVENVEHRLESFTTRIVQSQKELHCVSMRRTVVTDNEVYILLRVPNVEDREAQILAMILQLMEHGPTGTPARLDAKPPDDKLIAPLGTALDFQQRRRIAKYLHERFGRGR